MPPKNSNIQENEINVKKSTIMIVVIITMVFSFFLGVFFGFEISPSNNPAPIIENAIVIKNEFLDINNSGLDDYVIYAEVIINENQNFIEGQ